MNQELQDQLEAARKAEAAAIQERDNFDRLQGDLSAAQAALAQRQTDLEASEQSIKAREDAVALKESEEVQRLEVIKTEKADLATLHDARESEYQEHVARMTTAKDAADNFIATRHDDLAIAEQHHDERTARLDAWELALADRETSVTAREEAAVNAFQRLEEEKANYKDQIRAELMKSLN